MKIISPLLRNIISLAVLAILAVIAWQNVDFQLMTSVSIKFLILITIPVIVFTLARTYTLKIGMSCFNIKLRFYEWFGLGIYASLLNLALPFRTGLSIKAIYLKRMHEFQYSNFIGMQGAMSLTQLFTITLIASPILLLSGVDWPIIVVPWGIVILTLSAAFLLPRLHGHQQSRLLGAMVGIRQSFLEIIFAKKGEIAYRIIWNAIASFLATSTALYFSLKGLGTGTEFTGAITLTLAMTFLNIVTITPGNFGIQEFAGGYLATYLGLDFDTGFIATLLVRIISISFMLAVSPFFLQLHNNAQQNKSRMK
jgi:uncharacterized membrane protein YbhN (UPF0104 family)